MSLTTVVVVVVVFNQNGYCGVQIEVMGNDRGGCELGAHFPSSLLPFPLCSFLLPFHPFPSVIFLHFLRWGLM